MKTRLLSTVAASLLLTAGVATAQSPTPPQAPERAPAAQQSAPAEKVAPPMRKGSETTGQAPKADQDKPAAKGASEMKDSDSKSPSTTGQAPSGTRQAPAAQGTQSGQPAPNAQSAPSAQSQTTGQGAAAGAAKLSTEQQTKVTTAFKAAKIESMPKTQINVSIAVGTKLPATVRLLPVPAQVVAVYPQWRGYYVILVDGQYLIIEPRTREIVYIIV